MPKSLKDIFLDRDFNVPFVERPAKAENIVNSEIDEDRPLRQFIKKLPELYTTDLLRIESAGTIDPARTTAVRGARYNDPNKPGGLGLNIGNLLGGPANRPSDTIFENKTSSPVSKGKQPVNGDWSGLKYAVEEDKDYLISQSPMKDNFLSGLAKPQGNSKDLANNAIGKVARLGVDSLRKGINKVLTSNRKTVKKKETSNATQFTNKLISSEYFKNLEITDDQYNVLKNRNDLGITSFNSMRDSALEKTIFEDKDYKELIKKHQKTGVTYITFTTENNSHFILPTAFTGEVTETITSDWSEFKYVGSPFKNYRYLGVSRDLKISFNVYWLNLTQQKIMQQKLNTLRGFAFPSKNLASVKLGGDSKYVPLVFSPNLYKFSLGDYYKNLDVIISNVSIGIPQNISWGSTNPNFTDDKNIVFPTVVNVNVDMKIIETGDIASDGKTITYRLDDMSEPNGNENAKPNQQSATAVSSEPNNSREYSDNPDDWKFKQ